MKLTYPISLNIPLNSLGGKGEKNVKKKKKNGGIIQGISYQQSYCAKKILRILGSHVSNKLDQLFLISNDSLGCWSAV